MPTKIFTTISGPCPFGKNITIDSPGCRSCEKYYRAGTGMFFWCNAGSESCSGNLAPETQAWTAPKNRRPRKGQKEARKDTQKEKWISCTKTGRNARKSKIWKK